MSKVVPSISAPASLKVEVLASGLRFPEGPAFAADGSLWLVELHGESLLQWQAGILKRYHVGGMPNGIAIDRNGAILFCDAGLNAIRVFNPRTETLVTIVDNINGLPLHAPNDLAFDLQGNLVFTCPGNSRQEPSGYVCVLTPQGIVKKIAEGMFFPNGLAFTKNGDHLIVAETYRHRLWKGRWDARTCTWLQPAVFAETGGPVGPDGIAVGDGGDVYVAVFGSGKIKVFDEGGTLRNILSLPGSKPTNCAIASDRNRPWLAVTEAEQGQLLAMSLNEDEANIRNTNKLNNLS